MAAGNGHLIVAEAIKEQLNDNAAFKQLMDGMNEQRNTPLHWAVLNKRIEFARFLIQNGCETAIKNCDGELALDLAIGNDFEDLMVC